jgi:uncharacterized protein YbaP (TraB family)
VRRAEATLHIFAVRPPLPIPWTAPDAVAILEVSDEFWHETPEITQETQPLALRYGIDREQPLASRVPEDVHRRVMSTAGQLGMPPALLAPMRPWLAAQTLRMASEQQRGIDYQGTSPDVVLHRHAVAMGLPVKSEFPSAEAVTQFLAGLPAQAEVDFLSVELDELDALEQDPRRAELWLRGDLSYEEARAAETADRYPMFLEHLALARNRAWIPRIEAMLSAGTRAFIAVGFGHMVGPGSLAEELMSANLDVRRVSAEDASADPAQ